MLELNEFEKAIIASIEAAEEDCHSNHLVGDARWTYIIKEKLAHLGESLGNKVCTSGFKDIYNEEWLYDMVWYKEENDKLVEVSLVVESEWGFTQRQIKFDFEKLLLANSKTKLMICQSSAADMDGLKNYFYDAIQAYRLNCKSERFIIAILDRNPEIEEFDFVVFEKE